MLSTEHCDFLHDAVVIVAAIVAANRRLQKKDRPFQKLRKFPNPNGLKRKRRKKKRRKKDKKKKKSRRRKKKKKKET